MYRHISVFLKNGSFIFRQTLIKYHPRYDGCDMTELNNQNVLSKMNTDCEASRGRRRLMLQLLFQVFLPCRFLTPSSWSIICSSSVWSSALSGATLISLTALNSPQLFRCSFSRRKKFHTKRLEKDKPLLVATTSPDLKHSVLLLYPYFKYNYQIHTCILEIWDQIISPCCQKVEVFLPVTVNKISLESLDKL